jgi:hypothetical protein
MRARFEQLDEPSSKDLAFIRYIYETNFPPQEKVPFE